MLLHPAEHNMAIVNIHCRNSRSSELADHRVEYQEKRNTFFAYKAPLGTRILGKSATTKGILIRCLKATQIVIVCGLSRIKYLDTARRNFI